MNGEEILNTTEQLLTELETFISKTPWQSKYSLALKTLREELSSPCVLAIAGKVKSGKSSLLNSLLGIDLAMTGTTETTATINVFKAGNPPNSDKPILCQYLDGSQVWHGKDYLDNLQGVSKEALSEASKIDKLIFYIPNNPILNSVTIVDTPGIGALVGEDGNAHQVHTDAYFNLRERHKNETIGLSNNADAIIYLFDTVPTELDAKFLGHLYNGGKGLTALNGVGVLSKIDKDFSQVNNLVKYKKQFEHQLFTIVPTSSELAKYLPDLQTALDIKKALHYGFDSDSAFNTAILSQVAFLHPQLPNCRLTVEEREKILLRLRDDKFQWSIFRRIAERIYHSSDLESELKQLNDLTGISLLKDFIYSHFFNRAKLLRCHKTLVVFKTILSNIIYSNYFLNCEENASLKNDSIKACEILPKRIRNIVTDLIERNIPSVDQVINMKKKIASIRDDVDSLYSQLSYINDAYVTYQKILDESSQFTNDDISELETILSGRTHKVDCAQRLKYWNAVYNCSIPNSTRQNAASIAKKYYQEILKDI